MPGAGLRQSHGPESSGTTPWGWCRHRREASSCDPLLAQQLEDALVHGEQLLERDLALGRCRLIGDAHQREPGLRQLRTAAAAPSGSGARPRHSAATPGAPEAGSGTSSLSTPSRSRKPRPAAAALTDCAAAGGVERLPVALLDGQLGVRDQRVPDDRLKGLDQGRAQGRRRLDQDRRRRPARRASRREHRRRRRSTRRRSRAGLHRVHEVRSTRCARASHRRPRRRAARRARLRRETSSQPLNDVSQPSSFVRAVSSETLSVGA